MRFASFFAGKTLWASRQSRALRRFMAVTLLGIAVCIFVYLLVSAVVEGLHSRQQSLGLGLESGLQIQTKKPAELLQKLKADPLFSNQVLTVHQSFFGLVSSGGGDPVAVEFIKADVALMQNLPQDVAFKWQLGFSPESFFRDGKAVLLGKGVFDLLTSGWRFDDIAEITHPFADIGPTGEFEPLVTMAEVSGYVQTGLIDADDTKVYLSPLAFADFQNTLNLRREILVAVRDSDQAKAMQQVLLSQYGLEPHQVSSWWERNKTLLRLMELETLLVRFLFVLIALMTLINLAGQVRLFGAARKREILILKSLGASPRVLWWGFVQMGLALGAAGAFVGALCAGLVFGVLKLFPLKLPETYGFTQLPLHVEAKTFVFAIVFVLVVSALVSLRPGYQFSKWEGDSRL